MKIVDVDKMSKKDKKAYYNKYRNTWDINPVTRREADKKSKQHKLDKLKGYENVK